MTEWEALRKLEEAINTKVDLSDEELEKLYELFLKVKDKK